MLILYPGKKIQIPKLPDKIERIGITKILQLLSRGAKLIVEENGKEIMQINGPSQAT
jgi:hypothetical protein